MFQQDFLITKIHRVIYVGNNEYPETKTTFTHRLKHNELIFHFSGQTEVCFNSQKLITQPSTVRFLPQGECNRYEVIRQDPDDCIDIFFDTDRPISTEAFVQPVSQSFKVGELFKKIFSIWVAKDDGYYFECISILYKIFAELQKQTYLPEKQFHYIKPAVDHINRHFLDNDITAEKLAELCGISYSYIKRLFLKKYGLPPKKYEIQLRINYACDLLTTDEYNVSQIAEMAGFSDVSFFSRQFKEYMGISPNEFAKKYKSSK